MDYFTRLLTEYADGLPWTRQDSQDSLRQVALQGWSLIVAHDEQPERLDVERIADGWRVAWRDGEHRGDCELDPDSEPGSVAFAVVDELSRLRTEIDHAAEAERLRAQGVS